jgi:ADP-heptose:LPS heptosyltransferase
MGFLKSLERSLRRRFLAVTDRAFTGAFVTTPRDAFGLGDAPRILLLRQDRIGDVLVSVPVIRALRHRYPRARIDMLFSRSNYGVRQAIAPYIDHAWRYDKTPASALQLIGAVRAARYDVVVNLTDNPSVSSQLLARWSGAPYQLGIRHEHAGHYTHAVPLLDRGRVHIVERMAQLLLPFGIDPAKTPLELEYQVSDADRALARTRLGPTDRGALRLGVNIAGSSRLRYWGNDNFIACIRWMRDFDPRFAIWVGGAPAYQSDVEAIATATGAAPLPPLASFHEFAAVLREFDVLLTPDTSVVHLAAAWQTPMVGLFRQSQEVMPWYPYHSPYRAVVHAGGVPSIPVKAVEEALRALVVERFPGGAAG